MSIIIRTDSDASAFSRKTVSQVQNGLILDAILDTNLVKVLNNFSVTPEGGDSMEAVGAPVISNIETQLTSLSSFIQTDISHPGNEYTVMGVSRSLRTVAEMNTGSNQPMMLGNYAARSGVYTGMAMGYTASSGRMNWGQSILATDGTTAMVSPAAMSTGLDPKQANLWAFRCSIADRLISIRSHTHNYTLSNSIAAGGVVSDSGEKIRIGSGYTSQSGPCAISRMRMWNRVLSDAEVNIAFAEMALYEKEHNGRTV